VIESNPLRMAAEIALTGGLSMVMTAMPSSMATLMGWDKARLLETGKCLPLAFSARRADV
jgi:hypothetical protein